MNIDPSIVALLIAIVCFCVAAFGSDTKVNFTPLGFAFVVLSMVV